MSTSTQKHRVTQLLDAISDGDSRASAELLPLIYDELRKLAQSYLAKEAHVLTLQPTALVHEAHLRLVGTPDAQWSGRGHFFGAAAQAMRRILVVASHFGHDNTIGLLAWSARSPELVSSSRDGDAVRRAADALDCQRCLPLWRWAVGGGGVE